MIISRDPNEIQRAMEIYDVTPLFRDASKIDFFVAHYRKGDFIRTPVKNEDLMQIVISGEVSIFYIMEDGSFYSIARGSGHSRIGEFESFIEQDIPLYSEACSDVTTLAFSMRSHMKLLLDDKVFMRSTIRNMSQLIGIMMRSSVETPPLKERALTHIQYQCENQLLSGVEANAFLLHCSPRQLQRVLNELVDEGKLVKEKKGTYRLQL